MNILQKYFLQIFLFSFMGILFINCEDGKDGVNGKDGEDLVSKPTMFSNKSSYEPLVAIAPQFNYVKAYSLISTADIINDSFQLSGHADGAGFLKEGDGYIYVVNCEDSYAVSRIRFDKNLTPVSGDYLLNSGVADYARQCSGTMWEANIHGGAKDIFLSASEKFSYDVKGIDPRIKIPTPTADFGLDALGEFSWENAVPLPKNTYSGRTVIIGGDDDSDGSEGQVVLYYSENGDSDLENGKIYVLRFKQISDGNKGKKSVVKKTFYNESSLDFGNSYDIEFVEIKDGKNLTHDEMETACDAVFAAHFMRVEDVDYQKGSDANGRNIFFVATGKGPGKGTYNDWGAVYKLELDEKSPLTGKLTQIVSGNTDTNNADGNMSMLQSPDNLCVTENFIYIQEDPNSFDRGHTAYIYQTDINGNNGSKVLELVVRQDLAENGSTGISGEFGSLIDISDKVGIANTFILAVQPHYWTNESFKNLDGHHHAINENNESSQIVLLKGLPR